MGGRSLIGEGTPLGAQRMGHPKKKQKSWAICVLIQGRIAVQRPSSAQLARPLLSFDAKGLDMLMPLPNPLDWRRQVASPLKNHTMDGAWPCPEATLGRGHAVPHLFRLESNLLGQLLPFLNLLLLISQQLVRRCRIWVDHEVFAHFLCHRRMRQHSGQ